MFCKIGYVSVLEQSHKRACPTRQSCHNRNVQHREVVQCTVPGSDKIDSRDPAEAIFMKPNFRLSPTTGLLCRLLASIPICKSCTCYNWKKPMLLTGEYWIIYRGPRFLVVVHSAPLPPPSPPSPVRKLSLILSLPMCRWSKLLAGEGEGVRSQLIRPHRSGPRRIRGALSKGRNIREFFVRGHIGLSGIRN